MPLAADQKLPNRDRKGAARSSPMPLAPDPKLPNRDRKGAARPSPMPLAANPTLAVAPAADPMLPARTSYALAADPTLPNRDREGAAQSTPCNGSLPGAILKRTRTM